MSVDSRQSEGHIPFRRLQKSHACVTRMRRGTALLDTVSTLLNLPSCVAMAGDVVLLTRACMWLMKKTVRHYYVRSRHLEVYSIEFTSTRDEIADIPGRKVLLWGSELQCVFGTNSLR